MWRQLIESQSSEHEFAPPCTWAEMSLAEEKLRSKLPEQLRSLLQETNGVVGEYGLGLIWPLDRFVADNLAFRSNTDFQRLYMPFDPLLFFADAGNGDQFALPERKKGKGHAFLPFLPASWRPGGYRDNRDGFPVWEDWR